MVRYVHEYIIGNGYSFAMQNRNVENVERVERVEKVEKN
jgi:hypothetical protein